MSTYSDASLILPVAPERKAGKIYSLKPTDGTGDFTVARLSQASEINSDLKIVNVANNVPRFTYDTLGGCPSLLTEPQSTNLITYPVSFDNAYWTKSGASVVSGQASPHVDYPTSSFKLVQDTATSNHFIRLTSVISFTLGASYSLSIFAKKGEVDYIKVQGVAAVGAMFNLSNGTKVQDADSRVQSSSIEALADGWYRCSVTLKEATRDNDFLYAFLSEDGTNTSYLGDGISGAYIFGGQLEEQSVATSFMYNGTEGATVTRNADIVTGAGDVNTFNSSEGVLFAEMSALSDDLTFRYISISDGTTSNRIVLRYLTNSNEINVFMIVTGVSVTSMTYTSSDITINSKIAFKWKTNDFALWVDGVERDTDLGGAVFNANTLNVLNLTNAVGTGSQLFAKTKQIQVYTTALSDTELQTLTTL